MLLPEILKEILAGFGKVAPGHNRPLLLVKTAANG